jgi:hypothetical protein
MRVLICEEARPLLEEYHDEELPVGDQIAVRAHLEWCDECAAIATDLRLMRDLLRGSGHGQTAFDREERDTFQAAVIGRARAEFRPSWSARIRDIVDDRRIVYAGIGAAAATVFCVLVLTSMMRFAGLERPSAMVSVFRLLASPKVVVEDLNAPGTDANPVVVDARMLMPRPLDQIFISSASATDESLLTLSAVVTREGRVKNLEWHSPSGHKPKAGSREAEAVDTLLSAASFARFEPARVAGLPVAVNMVWLVANTTVRGSKRALDLPIAGPPGPRKRPATAMVPVARTRAIV